MYKNHSFGAGSICHFQVLEGPSLFLPVAFTRVWLGVYPAPRTQTLWFPQQWADTRPHTPRLMWFKAVEVNAGQAADGRIPTTQTSRSALDRVYSFYHSITTPQGQALWSRWDLSTVLPSSRWYPRFLFLWQSPSFKRERPWGSTSMLMPQTSLICSIHTSAHSSPFWLSKIISASHVFTPNNSFSGSPIWLTSLGRPAVLWTLILSWRHTRYLKNTACLMYAGPEHTLPGWWHVFQTAHLLWFCFTFSRLLFLMLQVSVTLLPLSRPTQQCKWILPTQGLF